jgi:thiol:disulfide interchange protein
MASRTRHPARALSVGWGACREGFDVDGSVAKGYGVIGLPQTFFIRADGTIAARVPAELTAETFRDQVARITKPS